MAGKIPDLNAKVRAGTGKGAARQARRDGDVPGIVYGGGVDPQSISIPFNYLLTMLRKGRFMSTLFNLKVEGQEDVRVICRGVQRDVVKDLPVHIDLMRLKRTSRVKLFIPVEFLNADTCPGVKKGGVLTVVRPEVELEVLAGDIPESIEIDLAEQLVGVGFATREGLAEATLDDLKEALPDIDEATLAKLHTSVHETTEEDNS